MIPDAHWRERGERLRAFVAGVQGKDASWDECSTWPAQWVADEIGRAFDWPDYGSEEEGRAIVEAAGGLAGLWGQVARQIGLHEISVDRPSLGDVGIIETTRWGQVGGIFCWGGGIFVRSQVGASAIGVVGRTFPFRVEGGVEHRNVVVKAWQVA